MSGSTRVPQQPLLALSAATQQVSGKRYTAGNAAFMRRGDEEPLLEVVAHQPCRHGCDGPGSAEDDVPMAIQKACEEWHDNETCDRKNSKCLYRVEGSNTQNLRVTCSHREERTLSRRTTE